MYVKKLYTDHSSAEFTGGVNYETSMWNGEYKVDGVTKCKFSISVPLFTCIQCKSKLPEDNSICMNCVNAPAPCWNVQIQTENGPQARAICIDVRAGATTQSYRLNFTGEDDRGELYKVSGLWMDDRILLTKRQLVDTEVYKGRVESEANEWTWNGVMNNSKGENFPFRFNICQQSCITCGEKVPLKNFKCLKCQRKSMCNWKSESAAVEMFIVVTRDKGNGFYNLVGNGRDRNGEFEAFGTWEDKTIRLTIFNSILQTQRVLSGDFDKETKTWSSYLDGQREEILIPHYACHMCEQFTPIQNDLCLNCAKEQKISDWTEPNGSPFDAWVGECQSVRCGKWITDEIIAKVSQGPENSYQIEGFGKDAAGCFSLFGSWKDEQISLTRFHLHMQSEMSGKYDPSTSEWSGVYTLTYDIDRSPDKGEFRYVIPMWLCKARGCLNKIPMRENFCFKCSTGLQEVRKPQDDCKKVQWLENISSIINKQDLHGRTAIMYAAENGNLKILAELLAFVSPYDMRISDDVGNSAIDYALNTMLAIPSSLNDGKTTAGSNSQELDKMENVELLRKRSSRLIALNNSSFDKSGADDSLYDLAKSDKWDDLEMALCEEVSGDKLNAKDKRTGSTIAHHVCRQGNTKILKMLLEQPEMDFYTHDKEEKNPLSIAAETGHDGCVTFLLRAGIKPYVTTRRVPRDENERKCQQMIKDKFALMQHERLKLYYQVNVPSEKCAKDHINAKQSPLHAAIINYQSIRVLGGILNNEMVDVDQKDEDGNTALILASNIDEDNILTSDEVSKLRKLSVGLLLSIGAEINITNKKKRTALMTATMAGNVEVVRLLVENMAHMDVQDEDGKTCLDLVNQCKQETSRNEIKSLLQSEEQKRASSVDFRDEYVKTYLSMTQEEALVQGGFSKVVNCSPEFARTFLDDCVEVHRHNFKFSQLLQVYGKNVKSSVLYSILNLKSKDPNLVMDACKVCLEHVVMRHIMEIKWELFGQRKYCEQLTMNMLLLVTLSISSILLDDEEMTSISSGILICGVSAVVFSALSFSFLQLLRPQFLWQLSRYLHDGTLAFEPNLEIQNLPEKKRQVKLSLVYIVLSLTVILLIPILYWMDTLGITHYFPNFNHLVLWLTVTYFLATEIQEARAGGQKYFKSSINKGQMVIYLVIFFIFVPLKLGLLTFGMQPDSLMAVEIGVGAFISISLWLLTVQFLEVVPSASYLLPMMSNLLQDVGNFFIFFGVFQMGLTITFYQLFKQTGDESFQTITQSFITTYFVPFGQLPLDSLKSFQGKDGEQSAKNYILASCATILIMFHAAVVVILLLNMLLAMMNKTFEAGFEKAKTEALTSYAKCILRLEESIYLINGNNESLIYFQGPNGKVVNPIFQDTVPKTRHSLSDDQEAEINAYWKKKKGWNKLIDDLENALAKGLNDIKEFILDVKVPTKSTIKAETALKEELEVLRQTEERVEEFLKCAKDTRGQDPEKALKRLVGSVKRELTTFEDDMKRKWHCEEDEVSPLEHKIWVCAHKSIAHKSAKSKNVDEMLSEFKNTVTGKMATMIEQIKD